MTTKTTSTTTAATTTTAPTATRTATRSIPQMQQTHTFQAVAKAWAAMSDTDRNTWLQLAQAQTSPGTLAAKPARSAYQTFVAVNTAALAAGLTCQTTAPGPQSGPPALPPVLFQAKTTPAVALTLASAPYTNKILVYAAAPALAAQATYGKGAFKLIGALPGFSAGTPADITALYLARFRAPSPGTKVAVQLVGVSAGGLRTAALQVTALTAATALDYADAPGDGQANTRLRAA